MKTFWTLAGIYAALAIFIATITSCEPGMPLTVSGFYRTTDGSKAGISTTFVPVAKVIPAK